MRYHLCHKTNANQLIRSLLLVENTSKRWKYECEFSAVSLLSGILNKVNESISACKTLLSILRTVIPSYVISFFEEKKKLLWQFGFLLIHHHCIFMLSQF